jgi:enoyl-CoA hydratase/carnithine racemase
VSSLILYELRDGVAVLSFNRPERHNAINDELHEEWGPALRTAIADSAVRCILLRGEGPSFSSGRDTSQLGQRVAGESDFHFVRRHQDGRVQMLDAPKPIVAAVRGYALGGGFETALAADMRIASSDAVMGFPEIEFGLTVDTGGSQLLTAVAGPARAKWLLMSGDRIGAAQALEWGIVDWVVEPDELDERALAIAARLATRPPTAVAMSKQLVDQLWGPSIRNGMRQELLAQVALFAGDEHKQAKATHLEAHRNQKG